MNAQRFIRMIGTAALAGLLAGCSTLEQGTGILSDANRTKDKIEKTAKIVRSTFADITEEEEYYIGRSVSAMILSRYPAYNNDGLTRYVNTVGNTVACFSARPEIYAGYHFLILDSDEINAMAAPGGFVFVTRGLLKRCKNEEMLACVLAHEVGHVAEKHGLQSIKKSRLLDAFGILGKEVVERYGSETLNKLTDIFEGTLSDVVESLVERGYDRKYEYEADKQAVQIVGRTGYVSSGLTDFLKILAADPSSSSGKGWFKTHPSPDDRIGRIGSSAAAAKTAAANQALRTVRFKQSVGSLK